LWDRRCPSRAEYREGQPLEQDETAQINDAWWELETTVSTAGKVIVEAFDLAGNCTKHEA